ncbi:MAG: hypothetical protein SV775_18220 [Thermodesulfobacteriota bacterium]|nr:hypothetical protein [Thermodesulfobacteriota bacterium]
MNLLRAAILLALDKVEEVHDGLPGQPIGEDSGAVPGGGRLAT